MSNAIETLVFPYTSWNEAYRKFRGEYRYLNTFYYLFLTSKEKIQELLKEQIKKHDESAIAQGNPLDYAMGVVTHVYSRSKFKGVHVARSDAIKMAEDFSGFLSIISRHCVISAHRSVVDYSFDLLRELDAQGFIELEEKEKEAILFRRMRLAKLGSLLEAHKVPLSSEQEVIKQLRWLAELRNCIEHNGCLASEEFLSFAEESEVGVGAPIPVGPKEVGEALALIEKVCSAMNQKAHAHYYSATENGSHSGPPESKLR